MSEEEMMARLQALTHLLNELRAKLDALTIRLTAAEQSLANRWIS